METPLLASEGDTSTPSLGSGPALNDETEFTRLISQHGSPLQALTERFDHDEPFRQQQQQHQPESSSSTRGTFATIAAGTLSLFHIGFIWGSYMSNVWTETHLRIAIDWQKEFLPMLDDVTDRVIRSLDLAVLLQDLHDTKQYILLGILWASSLLLPCTFMILSPTFVVTDRNEKVSLESRMRRWTGRGILECGMRCSLMTVYVFVLLGIASSAIEIKWTGTTIQVRNQALGAFAAYTTGIASAIGLAMVLRSPMKEKTVIQSRRSQSQASIRSPPPHAFRYPWRLVDSEEPSMTVLEESPPVTTPPTRRTVTSVSTPELATEASESVAPKMTYCQKVLVFQVGILSMMLWIPSLYLPLVRISYFGLGLDFMTESSLKLYVWQIPSVFWNQGLESGTAKCALMVVGAVLFLTLLALPVLATCLGIVAWLGDDKWARGGRDWLYCLHPALGGVVFSIALIATVHAYYPMGSYILDEDSLEFCKTLEQTANEPCLDLTGQLLPGAWAYLVHSIVLEIFALTTVGWWYA